MQTELPGCYAAWHCTDSGRCLCACVQPAPSQPSTSFPAPAREPIPRPKVRVKRARAGSQLPRAAAALPKPTVDGVLAAPQLYRASVLAYCGTVCGGPRPADPLARRVPL